MSDEQRNVVDDLLATDTEFQCLHETHRSLKAQISAASGSLDSLSLSALKREKLRAKDRMEELIRAHT
ncbi:MAG: DUF465 domain-containing protein [Pseudomonadota bacterium]